MSIQHLVPALILVPATAGALAFLIRPDLPRRALLLAAAVAHFALIVAAWRHLPQLGALAPGDPDAWLRLDGAGLLFLSIASTLFLAASFYGIGYLAQEKREAAAHGHAHDHAHRGGLLGSAPETVLTGCLLFFLATMSLVCLSNHLGLLWVAVEATTLASAPLIYFHRHARSLEAAWKYLLICSIGIALALLGNFLLAVATRTPAGEETPLILTLLLHNAHGFQPLWLKAGFIFLLVGYGAKMGLAPLHTWLPDAHSESPSVVSALLSGALLNCAFLGILRGQQVLAAAGLAAFGQELLILFGLLSMAFAAVFILGQADYKRMLAYSSVEHMGILALGVGLGGAATFGALLHAVNHSLTKAMLFFVAGNILAAMKTKSTADVRGLSRTMPLTAALWLAGFFAITGTPPFGMFVSEFTILRAALDQGHPWVGVAYLALLSLIFIAMALIVLRMAQGKPAGGKADGAPLKESWLAVAPPAALGALTLALGLYLPPFLETLLREAALALGGRL